MTSSTHRLIAILMLAGSFAATGCDSKKEPAAGTTGDTATVIRKDSATTTTPAPAASDVATYTFHGTPTKIDKASGTITVDHEKIGDFMEAMEMSFNVADPALLDKAIIGKNTHFTLRVAGTDMLITNIEDSHAPGAEH